MSRRCASKHAAKPCTMTMLMAFLASPALLAHAQSRLEGGPITKIRVAVTDLSGSALRIQSTQMPGGGPQPSYPSPGYPSQGRQTTVTIAIPPPAEFARGLTEALTTVLVKSGRFIVLERAAMQQVQQEQQIGASGAVTKETAAGQGKLLGAQVLITGDITGFTYERSSIGGKLTNIVKGLSAAMERVSAEVIIDLRVIDAGSGEVLHSHKGTGKASQTGVAADLIKDDKDLSGTATLTTPLGQASRQALQSAVAGLLLGLPKIRWAGQIVDVREGVVYLNAGAEDGIRVGLELDVFEAQPALIDPATGRNLGALEKPIGSIVVDQVLEKFSTARVTAGQAFARGHIVRLKKWPPAPRSGS